MCCTTVKEKHNIDTTKTEVFTKEAMLNKSKEETEKETEALFYEYGDLKFCILYIKEYFTGMSSFAFYAMSRGLEAYTATGYKSNFAGVDTTEKDIKDYFKSELMKCGINLDNPKPLLMSDVGGLCNVSQPSLF